MSARAKKIILLVLAAALLTGTSFVQKSMNQDRERLGLTRVEPLKNAPPVLAFTTVALGGFRGLISNALWIRASELQDNDKFFEMAQLADWITKLEPHFVQVWLVQAWNMAYNISVKFKDYPDRWRWVQRGIALLRDEGLVYNPNELLIYRELAWFFQHKMGANLDDASLYYKHQWALEMSEFFGKKKPDLTELLNPTTPEASNRVYVLRTKYKMDPEILKQVDDTYGPLEWRLPESHAVYWAWMGLKAARENPSKVKTDDLMTLRRVVYQSMQMSFHRGRLVQNPFTERFDFGPNLDIVPNVSKAYEQAAEAEPASRDHILTAHRNFLRDAVYFLYTDNRRAEAMKWFRYIAEKYPNKQMLDGRPETLPANISLDEYAVARVQTDVEETDHNRVQGHIEGLIAGSYHALVFGEEGRYQGLHYLAQRVWEAYMSKVPQDRMQAIGLRPYAEIRSEVLRRLLDVEKGLPPEARAILRTQLNMPAEEAPAVPVPAPQQTNQPAAASNT